MRSNINLNLAVIWLDLTFDIWFASSIYICGWFQKTSRNKWCPIGNRATIAATGNSTSSPLKWQSQLVDQLEERLSQRRAHQRAQTGQGQNGRLALGLAAAHWRPGSYSALMAMASVCQDRGQIWRIRLWRINYRNIGFRNTHTCEHPVISQTCFRILRSLIHTRTHLQMFVPLNDTHLRKLHVFYIEQSTAITIYPTIFDKTTDYGWNVRRISEVTTTLARLASIKPIIRKTLDSDRCSLRSVSARSIHVIRLRRHPHHPHRAASKAKGETCDRKVCSRISIRYALTWPPLPSST